MGNSVSSEQVSSELICNSKNFKMLLDILDDANDVSLYYAELLLEDKLPIKLEYKNYSKQSKIFFNKTKSEKLEDIDMSYNDFYNQLSYLNYMYDDSINDETTRRNMIMQVFDKSYKIQKHLIKELRM